MEERLSEQLQRWPDIVSWLAQVSPGESVRTDPATKCLMYRGTQLTSRFQQHYIERRIKLIPQHSSLITFYGIGDGQLLNALVAREDLQNIQVVLLDRWLSTELLRRFEHTWLQSAKVSLSIAGDARRLPGLFLFEVGEVAATHQEGRALKQEIERYALEFEMAHFQPDAFKPREQNANIEDLISKDGDVADLFGAFKDRPAIVLGGGPSFDHFKDVLVGMRSSVTLVAVGTALAGLERIGIVPDLVIVLDPGKSMFAQLAVDASAYQAVGLVYFPSVRKGALDAWPGPRYTVYAEVEKNFADLAEKYPRGRLVADSSVSVSALSLAAKLGASRIYLLGMDFAHLGGFSHAQDAHTSKKSNPVNPLTGQRWELIGYCGEWLQTTPSLVTHLRAFERLVEALKPLPIENISPLGAKIEGVGLYRAND